jgi:hypothetical protein
VFLPKALWEKRVSGVNGAIPLIEVSQALRVAHRAEELDPLTPERKSMVGLVHHLARQYDPAAEQYRQLTHSDPDLPVPHIRLFDIYSRT